MKGASRLPGAPTALALLLWCVVALPCRAADGTPAPPVLGVEPIVAGTVMEHHPDAVPHWVERGFAGAVLLHVDAGHGMSALDAKSLAALRGLAGERDLPALARAGRGGGDRLFREANFARVAAGLGIVREVVWVAPFQVRLDGDGPETLRAYLAQSGLSEEESASFRPVDGVYRGLVGGVPVSLCAREGLPAIRDPVLLSIGADYFTAAAAYRGATPLVEIRRLFAALREARYAVLDAVFAYSVQEGELSPDLRWVGAAVLEVLRDPAIALGETPPERWRVLQRLATLGARGDEGVEMEMLGMALAELEKQPHDPALLLYAAAAAARHGMSQALSYARQACRVDSGSCAGLGQIGLRFVAAGDVEAGLGFFAAAEALHPGFEYGRLDLGIALMKVGRATEALAVLEKVRERAGAFPSGFLIGTVHLFLEDRPAARRSFDAALAAVERGADFPAVSAETARAVAIAADFYREEGLEREARVLENDARLRLPAAPGP